MSGKSEENEPWRAGVTATSGPRDVRRRRRTRRRRRMRTGRARATFAARS
jgi:hypothetical protein